MLLEAAVLLVVLAGALYLRLTRHHGYFRSRGIPEEPPVFPWGSETHGRMFSGKVSFVTASGEIYQKHRGERFVGHYEFGTPRLLVVDLELAKSVMIKDFDHFVDRRSVHGLNLANPVNK